MTPATLAAAMPGLSAALAERYQPPNDAAMVEFGITTAARAWQWLAQVGHESVSLRFFSELASGAAYEGRTDLGNTQPGDGVRYKGRGPIQITGRSNYTAAGAALGLDLVGHPELAADPRYAFRLSAWWWANHGLNQLADTGDVVACTRRINGGLNGLADRQARYARCRALGPVAVLPSGSAAPPAPAAPEPPPPAPVGGPMLSAPVRDPSGTVHFAQIRTDGQLWRWWIAQGKQPQHDIVPQGGDPHCDPLTQPVVWMTDTTLNVVAERTDNDRLLQGWLPKGGQWGTRIV